MFVHQQCTTRALARKLKDGEKDGRTVGGEVTHAIAFTPTSETTTATEAKKVAERKKYKTRIWIWIWGEKKACTYVQRVCLPKKNDFFSHLSKRRNAAMD